MEPADRPAYLAAKTVIVNSHFPGRRTPRMTYPERLPVRIRHSTAHLFAVLLVATVGLAGCGSNATDSRPNAIGTTAAAPATTAPATRDATPCPLDAATLSRAISVEMTRTSSARCGFVEASAKSGRVIEVYYTPIDAVIYEESEGERVPGVGDGARWDTQLSGSLLVKTGSRHFSVQAVAMGDLPEQLRAMNLAVTVAHLILTKP